ncbi:hypothetical protein Scep_028605 [Stephania cephalantha]|uniref:Uncharacterized protein n=1 Tax=Stephania cephalantha TaxID=152367 RepID=A0AAP0EEE8_9MAGN
METDQTVEAMEVRDQQQQQPQLQNDQNVKQRGRSKSGKVAAPKRPPQRGLGVAQLERLRLQERWKKMTEIHDHHTRPAQQAPQARLHFHHHHHQQQQQQQQQVFHHANHQLQFQYFPFPISAHGGSSVAGGTPPTPPSPSPSPFPSVHDQYLKFDPARSYGSAPSITSDVCGVGSIGAMFQPFSAADRARISAGELSSSQKIHGVLFDRSSTNTRGLNFHGENLGFVNGGVRGHHHHHQYMDQHHHHHHQNMVSVESCDLLRLNLGQTNSTTSTIVDGSSRGNLWHYSSSPNSKEEVEVVAVHRRGNPTSSGSASSVLMEYEFFPRSSRGSSTNYSNKQCHSSSSIAEAHHDHQSAEQSPMSITESSLSNNNNNTDSTSTNNTTSLIDLSLRLSC